MAAARNASHPSDQPHYLSHDHQLLVAKNIHDDLMKRLNAYRVKDKNKKHEADLKLEDLEKKDPGHRNYQLMFSAKHTLVRELQNKLDLSYKTFEAKSKKRETKENKLDLQRYVDSVSAEVENLVKLNNDLCDKYKVPKTGLRESSLSKSLREMKKELQEQKTLLNKTVDLQIYVAKIPKQVWEKDFAPYKDSFYIRGRPVVAAIKAAQATGIAAAVVGGIALAVVTAPIWIPFAGAMSDSGAADPLAYTGIGGGSSRGGGSSKKEEAFKKEQALPEDSFDSRANTLSRDIPKNYYVAKIDIEGFRNLPEEQMKKEMKALLNQFREIDQLENTVTIYFLEGQDPRQVKSQGTGHMLDRKENNRWGRTLYFDSLPEAITYRTLFYLDQASYIKRYDPIGGWRMNHDWDQKQLQEVWTKHAEKERAEQKQRVAAAPPGGAALGGLFEGKKAEGRESPPPTPKSEGRRPS